MAFPSRMLLGDVPFRYLSNFFATVQALSILLDDSADVGREILREAGLQETQINYLYDRYTRPVLEAFLNNWQGTVRDLYRILRTQPEARRILWKYLHENAGLSPPHQQPNQDDWENVLQSTRYTFSTAVTWPQIATRTYIRPFFNRAGELLLPSGDATDMYRAISNIINFGTKVILCLKIIQTASALCSGRLQNLVTIFISVSLWVKLYLIREPLRELKAILPCGNDSRRVRRADFLYKQVRIALLFAFYFKLALAFLGSALFCAFPQFLLNDLQSQMTQVVIFLFTFELAHNAFYLITFYRDPNIFRIINQLFPF